MGENAVGRRLERLLGVGPHGQAHIQPRPRVPTERPPNPQPLPEPLRADEKGLDGQERQTLRKELAKEGLHVPLFVPTTYMLPADYSLFVEEFRRRPNTTWIMKPTSKARGICIFIVNKLSQIKKWANNKWASGSMRDNYVISRYLDNPLLIGGKKFDLRLYALVTSYRPLRVYMYREGFCRFSGARYSNDNANLDNMFMHLTNVSIQTKADDYNDKHGGKWSLRNFRLYIEGQFGQERAAQVFEDIERIILLSLKSVQSVVINDKHCFECYGYDVLVDDNLKSWLIEINASPSLSATTHSDRVMKHKLINDIFRVVVPDDDYIDVKDRSHATGVAQRRIGQFELMYDEAGSVTGKFADHSDRNRTDDARNSHAKWR